MGGDFGALPMLEDSIGGEQMACCVISCSMDKRLSGLVGESGDGNEEVQEDAPDRGGEEGENTLSTATLGGKNSADKRLRGLCGESGGRFSEEGPSERNTGGAAGKSGLWFPRYSMDNCRCGWGGMDWLSVGVVIGLFFDDLLLSEEQEEQTDGGPLSHRLLSEDESNAGRDDVLVLRAGGEGKVTSLL